MGGWGGFFASDPAGKIIEIHFQFCSFAVIVHKLVIMTIKYILNKNGRQKIRLSIAYVNTKFRQSWASGHFLSPTRQQRGVHRHCQMDQLPYYNPLPHPILQYCRIGESGLSVHLSVGLSSCVNCAGFNSIWQRQGGKLAPRPALN